MVILSGAKNLPYQACSTLRRKRDRSVYVRFLASLGMTIDNRAEPLAAVDPREASVDFQRALSGADFSLQSVVRRLVESGNVREISVTGEEKKLFRNVNELADLQSA